MGGIPAFHTNSPLIPPNKPPMTIANTIKPAIGNAGKDALIIAVIMPTKARLEAIERSIQRVSITAI